MILSDKDIITRLCNGSLIVEPSVNVDTQLQPASLDLRLGREFITLCSFGDVKEIIKSDQDFIIQPASFVLATTEEYIKIPADLAGRVEGRSSLGRLGILVHATAGFIDPGFEGTLTLEMSNLSPRPIALRPGMRVCQIVFQTLTSDVITPYGSKGRNKYHKQNGVTISKLYKDLD